jgi:hypothetical protein
MTVHPIRFGPVPASTEPAEAQDLQRLLGTLDRLDRDYGPTGSLPVEGADEVMAATLTMLARIAQHAPDASQLSVAQITTAVALWALNHGLELSPVEPVVNALALRANAARSPEAAAAIVSLMHQVIANVAPRLAPDLERSNPERPWRLLHANLAIAAIRTARPETMERAFDALEAALPQEAQGFYGEALALALNPAIPAEVRETIARRHGRA